MGPIRFILLLLGLLLGGSCDLVGSLPVAIADPVIFRENSDRRVLTATITRNGARMEDTGLSVTCKVSVRLTPNRASDELTITAVQGQGTSWSCTLPASFRIEPNQVFQSQWLVSSGATPVGDSGRKDQMLGCPNPAEEMIELQTAAIGDLPTSMRHDQIISAGFVPIHGFTSYRGRGVAFVRARPGANLANNEVAATQAMKNLRVPARGSPDILLFRPTGNDVTDANGPDNPYRLIGWGYAQTIRGAEPRGPSTPPASGPPPVQPRPRLHCVPYHEWLIHSSGRYYFDGTFYPGPTPPAQENPLVPTDHSYRPALWYLLLFMNEGSAPTIGMAASGPTPVPGITAPANSFYYPTAYD